MPTVSSRLKSFLDEHGVAYETIHHRADYTAQETAADTHTQGKEFAKTVLLWVDGKYALAVLPAHHEIDFDRLRREIGAKEAKLASEAEMEAVWPDCEVGAAPPFGNLYDLPVYLSSAMTDDERITFNAGTHEDAIRMSFKDYEKLVSHQVIDFTVPG